MKFSATFALLASTVAAAPQWHGWNGGNWNNNGCPSRSYVEGLIAQQITYLMHTDHAAAEAAGQAIFAEGFNEYGDSINSLRMAPLGTIVESSKEQYLTETLSEPSIPQIDSVSLTVECDQFVWQWKFYGIGPGPNPYISGFTLGKINSDGLIYYQYIEFNSLAWAENSGFTVSPPTSGPFAPGGPGK